MSTMEQKPQPQPQRKLTPEQLRKLEEAKKKKNKLLEGDKIVLKDENTAS